MNITEAKENILYLHEKSLKISSEKIRTHPIRIIQAVKSIIGINKDDPIDELLYFCEKYIDSFKLKTVNFDVDYSSVSEMVSYKNLEEALINFNDSLAIQRVYDLSKVSEGMQIIEFLLEFSFKYSKKSILLIWSTYRMMLFSDKKFMLQNLFLCVESILDSKKINESDYVPSKQISPFDLSPKEYDQYSVLCSIYYSDLVRKEKIIPLMAKFIVFDTSFNERYSSIYESRMKIWTYISEKKYNKLDCDMILDLDAIRSLMKIAEDNNLIPDKIYKYAQKYI